MFSYLAYGLGIQSSLPVPEFTAAEAGSDVVIRMTGPEEISESAQDRLWSFRLTPTEAIMPVFGAGTFVVREGREILIIRKPDGEEDWLRLYLLGTVMGATLYQRGHLVLHASAVASGEKAVAFLGQSGAGKSSAAAALHRQGHPVITDDVLAVNTGTSQALVYPGYPQLKLDRRVADVLNYNPKQLFQLHPLEDKWGYRIGKPFNLKPLPLHQIYVLATGPTLKIEPLTPQAAVIELIRHSYPTRFSQPGGQTHLRQCAYLAQQVPLYRLTRPDSTAGLPELARLVTAHSRQSA